MAEDAAHARFDDGDRGGLLDGSEEFGHGETGAEADGYGDGEQRDERLEPDPDDQEEEKRDTEGGDGQQSGGAVDQEEESTSVGWRPGRRWGGGEQHGDSVGARGSSGQGGARHGAPVVRGAVPDGSLERYRGWGKPVSRGPRARRSR
ncbi:hypothetical protein ACVWXU_003741 [Streptomyces sp. TE33382]